MTQSTSKVKELITEVAHLRPEELVEFEREWDLLRLRSLLGGALDEEAAEIAARFRLPPERQQRLQELLEAQAQGAGRLSPQEEEELDNLLQELDRQTAATAQALQELAERRASSQSL
jgi:predicted DNA-binding protein